MIFPYSIGGIFMPANNPLGLFESRAACSYPSFIQTTMTHVTIDYISALYSALYSYQWNMNMLPRAAAAMIHMPRIPTQLKLQKEEECSIAPESASSQKTSIFSILQRQMKYFLFLNWGSEWTHRRGTNKVVSNRDQSTVVQERNQHKHQNWELQQRTWH